MYQHIEFIDGSNPYISMTKRDFRKMQNLYVLVPIKEGFWKATDRISYQVVGFTDKNKYATYDRRYKTKATAMNFIRKAIKEKKFEAITLRKNIEYLRNSDSLNISSSCPIRQWEF